MKRLIFSLIITLLALSTAVAAPKGKIKKIIKKEVAACKAQGWKPISGAPSLEEQITTFLEHSSMFGYDGEPMYIIATMRDESKSSKMAETMAVQGCKTIAANKLLIELGKYEAEKNIKLVRPKRLAAMERKGKNGNTEVFISLAFNRAEMLEANKHLIEKN